MKKYPAFFFFIFVIFGEIFSLIYKNVPLSESIIALITLITLSKISKLKTKYIVAFILGYTLLTINIKHYEKTIEKLKKINLQNEKKAIVCNIKNAKKTKILTAYLIKKNKKSNIKIIIYAPKKAKIHKNSKIIFTQKLFFPKNKTNYINLLTKNVSALVYLNDKNFKIIQPAGNKQTTRKKIKKKIKEILSYGFSSKEESNIYSALTIGERNATSSHTKDIFKNTNTYHIFSISGLHFASIIIFLIAILNILKTNTNLKIIITIIFSLFYLHITEYRIPSIRAFIMSLLFILSNKFQRENTALNSLGISGIIILILNPFSLFSIGFMLSFLAVTGILITNTYSNNTLNKFYKNKSTIEKIKRKTSIKKYLFIKFLKYLLICLSAWIFTAPVILYYFKRISLSSIILNLILIPLISLTIQISIISIATGLIFKPLSFFPNKFAQIIIHNAIKIVDYTNQNLNLTLKGDIILIYLLISLIFLTLTTFFVYEEKNKPLF